MNPQTIQDELRDAENELRQLKAGEDQEIRNALDYLRLLSLRRQIKEMKERKVK